MARRIHTTRGGDSKPIVSMSDDHLSNTCRIAFKVCMEARNAVNVNGNALDTLLAGVEPMTVEQAAQIIRDTMEEFHPYFLEAYLRGLEGPRKMLQTIYNREQASDVVLPMQASHLLAEIVDNEED